MSLKKKLAIGTALFASTTATIHIINKLTGFSSSLDDESNPSSSFYEWKFGKIHYTKQGSGKPLLLIHDLNASSSSYEWNKIIGNLEKNNTVYAIDLLGCGESDKPNLTYTNYLYVQLVSDFIRQVIKEKTDVIATGASGSFVLAACQTDDSIINQIVLVNPEEIYKLAKAPTKRTKTLTLLINTPVYGTFLYNILTKKRNIADTLRDDYFYQAGKVTNEMIDTYYNNVHSENSASKHLFASLSGHYTTINVRHCLQELNNSIFILTGENDPTYRTYAEKYQDILPSIEIIDIKDSKYLPHLEEPVSFIEQIHVLLTSDDEL